MNLNPMPNEYQQLLQSFVELGYRSCLFDAFDPSKKHLILRHDLDMSIQSAVDVAAMEHELGLRATYFVLVRTEMYNPFSKRNLAALKQLQTWNHKIGLHLDASLYANNLETLDRAAETECLALESLLETPVEIISFHRPTEELQGLDRPVAGRPHTYEPRFFSKIGYCSDSRGEWRHGHPLEHPAVKQGRALQLLTHPIWWSNEESSQDVRSILDRFALRRFDFLRAELARQCQSYPQSFLVLDQENVLRDEP